VSPRAVTARLRRVVSGVFDLYQAKAWLSAYAIHRERSLRDAWGVWRRMSTRGLPIRPGGSEIWAISTVRDEADIIESVIRHLFHQGVDHVLICDHLSTDGTTEILARLASANRRVHVTSDAHPGHLQMDRITRLAQRAWWAGAGWIVPFDADEFWFARTGLLAAALRNVSAPVLRASVVNLVPVSDEDDDLDVADRLYRCDSGEFAPKVAFRAHPMTLIGPGNHGVNLRGTIADVGVIAHLPYRSAVQMARKFRNGAAGLDEAGDDATIGWHWRAGAALGRSELDLAWRQLRAGESIPALGWMPGALGPPGTWLAAWTWVGEPPQSRSGA